MSFSKHWRRLDCGTYGNESYSVVEIATRRSLGPLFIPQAPSPGSKKVPAHIITISSVQLTSSYHTHRRHCECHRRGLGDCSGGLRAIRLQQQQWQRRATGREASGMRTFRIEWSRGWRFSNHCCSEADILEAGENNFICAYLYTLAMAILKQRLCCLLRELVQLRWLPVRIQLTILPDLPPFSPNTSENVS